MLVPDTKLTGPCVSTAWNAGWAALVVGVHCGRPPGPCFQPNRINRRPAPTQNIVCDYMAIVKSRATSGRTHTGGQPPHPWTATAAEHASTLAAWKRGGRAGPRTVREQVEPPLCPEHERAAPHRGGADGQQPSSAASARPEATALLPSPQQQRARQRAARRAGELAGGAIAISSRREQLG